MLGGDSHQLAGEGQRFLWPLGEVTAGMENFIVECQVEVPFRHPNGDVRKTVTHLFPKHPFILGIVNWRWPEKGRDHRALGLSCGGAPGVLAFYRWIHGV